MELAKVIAALEDQGWRVERTRKGHWRCYAPDGVGIVVLAGTPSDHRSFANAVATLRRYGSQWPPRR
jgi:predicted RNA binding protein YcfA (HicA-like mRNA interferase family)